VAAGLAAAAAPEPAAVAAECGATPTAWPPEPEDPEPPEPEEPEPEEPATPIRFSNHPSNPQSFDGPVGLTEDEAGPGEEDTEALWVCERIEAVALYPVPLADDEPADPIGSTTIGEPHEPDPSEELPAQEPNEPLPSRPAGNAATEATG
jgi:hypothetical protein